MQRLQNSISTALRISIRILRWHKGKKHLIQRRLRRSVARNGSWILTSAQPFEGCAERRHPLSHVRAAFVAFCPRFALANKFTNAGRNREVLQEE